MIEKLLIVCLLAFVAWVAFIVRKALIKIDNKDNIFQDWNKTVEEKKKEIEKTKPEEKINKLKNFKFLILFLILFLFSCKNNSQEEIPQTINKQYVKHILIDKETNCQYILWNGNIIPRLKNNRMPKCD